MDPRWTLRQKSSSKQSTSTSDCKNRAPSIGEHHDGSFSVYMSHKKQKLEGENRKLQESVRCSSLFEGIAIFVNGYTVPSKEELRQLVIKHGGTFEFYETSKVTHIVATHLPLAKVRQYKKMRQPKPVVSPNWIVQSIEQMRVLPCREFIFEAFRDSTQSSLSFPTISSLSSKQGPSPVHGSNDDHDIAMEEKANEGTSTEIVFSNLHASPSKTQNLGIHCTESDATAILDVKHCSTYDDQVHSPKDGPAFVRNFFQKSRLHHIGTWRSRFQQEARRFMTLYEKGEMIRASPQGNERVILHVDMDCFFVSIALRTHHNREELQNAPLAVAHSSAAGTSEISSCNYVARACGVRAGMFVNRAKEFCSNLLVLSYDFEEVEKVSMEMYSIFFEYTPFVQAMSCDEAFLEFDAKSNGLEIATRLRKDVYERTLCIASVGVSYNILLAKLATRTAKPDGVFQIASSDEANVILNSLKVEDLPGVGKRTAQRLHSKGLESVEQLRRITKSELVSCVGGQKLGETLFGFVRGIDAREVSIDASLSRKSISAVINYGIRLDTWNDSVAFLKELAREAEHRLEQADMLTGCITLQVKRRKAGEPIEPMKYMGCGICDDFARSRVLNEATNRADIIHQAATQLLEELRLPSQDLRGIGILATKLIPTKRNSAIVDLKSRRLRGATLMECWRPHPESDVKNTLEELKSSAAKLEPKKASSSIVTDSSQRKISDMGTVPIKEKWSPPTLTQIDEEVLRELPIAIRDEIKTTFSKSTSAEVRVRSTKPAPRKKLKRNKKSVALKANSGNGMLNYFTTLNHVRFSQVDSQVYSDLPLQLRQELRTHTMKSDGSITAKRKISTTEPVIENMTIASQTLSSIQLLVIEVLYPSLTQLHSAQEFTEEVSAGSRLFDSIYARVLHEIDQRAMDRVLCMLRYTRRKCAEYLAKTADRHCSSALESTQDGLLNCQERGDAILPHDLVRNGFNQVLKRVNEDTLMRYQTSLASCVIMPL